MPTVEPVEAEDTGLSVWVVLAVVFVALALVSVPAWYLIDRAFDAVTATTASSQGADSSTSSSVSAEVPATSLVTFDARGEGLTMGLPEDWMVFPLYDGPAKTESFDRAEAELGPDAAEWLREDARFMTSVWGTRVVIAWDLQDPSWLSIGRWPTSENDHAGYVRNDMLREAALRGGELQEFDDRVDIGGHLGVSGVLAAPWTDAAGNYEEHWYVMWTDEYSFRLIFTIDEMSDEGRAQIGDMIETLVLYDQSDRLAP